MNLRCFSTAGRYLLAVLLLIAFLLATTTLILAVLYAVNILAVRSFR